MANDQSFIGGVRGHNGVGGEVEENGKNDRRMIKFGGVPVSLLLKRLYLAHTGRIVGLNHLQRSTIVDRRRQTRSVYVNLEA